MWSPQLANPLAWMLIVQTEQAVHCQPVDLLRGAGPATRRPPKLDDPDALAALTTPAGRAWCYFARFLIARVIRSSPTRVLLMDAGYPFDPPQRKWCGMLINPATGETLPPSAARP